MLQSIFLLLPGLGLQKKAVCCEDLPRDVFEVCQEED